MVEYRRAVLAAEIEALAVAGGRIVDPPERLEQLRVADLGRVEPDLDRLGVAGAVPADPLVGRVRDVPAGIPDSGLQHPVDLAEGCLDAPEASCGECRALGSVWAVALERRCQRRADGGAPVPQRKQVISPRCSCQRRARARDSSLTRSWSGVSAADCVVGTSAWGSCITAPRLRSVRHDAVTGGNR